jgi:hypothetical protein
LAYRDGFALYFLNGLAVTKQLIEAPETITAEQIKNEPNAEIRRHMLNRYAGLSGSEAQGKWVQDMNFEVVDTLDITNKMQPSGKSIWTLMHGNAPVLCKLYRAPMPEDEDLCLLWVVCTSTAKEVFLRVPPNMKTAKQARDWTFSGVKLNSAVET